MTLPTQAMELIRANSGPLPAKEMSMKGGRIVRQLAQKQQLTSRKNDAVPQQL